jgi:26S proteasome regulatory subunit N2
MLENKTESYVDKALIIRAFDEWEVMNTTWFEIAEYLGTIETLHHDVQFSERLRAALVVSKVYYCLQDYGNALRFALAAEGLQIR